MYEIFEIQRKKTTYSKEYKRKKSPTNCKWNTKLPFSVERVILRMGQGKQCEYIILLRRRMGEFELCLTCFVLFVCSFVFVFNSEEKLSGIQSIFGCASSIQCLCVANTFENICWHRILNISFSQVYIDCILKLV